MATVYLRNLIEQNRFQLDSINLNCIVNEFMSKVADNVHLSVKEIELIYCGVALQGHQTLDFYGVKNGSTIYALKKVIPEESIETEKFSEIEISKVLTALRMAVLNPGYRATVENLLLDPDMVENIIATTPGLNKDMVVLTMFQDLKLLLHLSQTKRIRQIIDDHPSFYHVAQCVAAAVNANGAKVGETSNTPAAYSLDQMSDEEESGSPLNMRADSPTPLYGNTGQGITASQLAVALAAATATGSSSEASTSGAGQLDSAISSDATGASPPITSDFFQQAIAQAQNIATQTQLQQLRDMGITDEALARHALREAGGDIQRALEYIFGDSGGM